MHLIDLFTELFAILAFITAIWANNRAQHLEAEVYRLRAELNYLYKTTGSVFEPVADDRIATLLRDGKKIAAIKLYRESTGKGLKESRDAIEALERGQSGVNS